MPTEHTEYTEGAGGKGGKGMPHVEDVEDAENAEGEGSREGEGECLTTKHPKNTKAGGGGLPGDCANGAKREEARSGVQLFAGCRVFEA